MLIKYKLGDVAKDFGKQNKELIGILGQYFEGRKTLHQPDGRGTELSV